MMRRILEIITDVRSQYPNDDFFSNFKDSCRNSPTKRQWYKAYNKALMILDNDSWQILKEKALQHFLDHRVGQKKQGFFNQLNESFAYRYLVSKGFDDVRFIKEGRNKTPDIEFKVGNMQDYCEVKSLGISDEEINRMKPRTTNKALDGSAYPYEWLSDGFLNKFCKSIETARKQLWALGTNGLVYIIIKFDDNALDCYYNYRKQLIKVCKINGLDDLFIKIGLFGNKRIFISSNYK